ncbi:hypothetical protein QBC35DRAFT_472672 [Podospora australis]|uniref:Uncharacterized protein n=1 Tax=Podospora australis TaxID=1536484 RepID=A0AAN6WW13_9PEZI|nr:hypothetical protein QBC35DRAFT_472672 [Podospora australis]
MTNPQDPSLPPSLASKTSSTTLTENQGGGSEIPDRYTYVERIGEPNPNAQAKPPSKLSKFFSKFQSPAVKKTNAAREKEKLEEERTGVRVYTPMPAPVGSGANTVVHGFGS